MSCERQDVWGGAEGTGYSSGHHLPPLACWGLRRVGRRVMVLAVLEVSDFIIMLIVPFFSGAAATAYLRPADRSRLERVGLAEAKRPSRSTCRRGSGPP